MDIYTLFKFVHIVSVIVWIGGAIALNILSARIAGQRHPAAQAALSQQAAFYGSRILGPASGITLIAGVVMIASAGISFATLWVALGLIILIASGALGGTVIRRTGERLAAVASGGSGSEPEVAALRSRLATLNWVNVTLLLIAVAAMVFKPTL